MGSGWEMHGNGSLVWLMTSIAMFSHQSGTAMFLCMPYGRVLSADLDPRNVKSYRIDWDWQCGQKVDYKYCSRMGILPRTYQAVWVLMGFDNDLMGI